MLKIDKIRLFRVDIPRRATYSRKTINGLQKVYALALTSGEHTGWGEVSASNLRCFEAAQRWARQLIGKNLPINGEDPFGKLSEWRADTDGPFLETTRRWLAPVRERISIRAYHVADRLQFTWTVWHSRQQRLVRELYSTAWFDLLGKKQGVPVHSLLGGAARLSVPGMPVLHVYDLPKTTWYAQAWCDLGFQYIKVKLAGNLEKDVEKVKAIRKQVPSHIRLQLDANYGYQRLKDIKVAVHHFADLDADIIEDPIMASLREYRELTEESPIGIMIDSKAWWPNIRNVCRWQACTHVNQHNNKQGGLDWAVLISKTAEANGIKTGIGSGGFLGIQEAAFQTLSSVIGLTRPCEAMVQYHRGPSAEKDRFGFDPVMVRELYPCHDGVFSISQEPGLGIEVDENLLRSRSVRYSEHNA